MTSSPPYRLGLTAILFAGVVALFFADATAADTEFQQCGKASWYKLDGKTASGEPADPGGMTAAHRTLPFGTEVTVTNLSNGRSVTLRINDRGPFSKGRVIDVTKAAAEKLGFINKGITRVKISTNTPISGKLSRENC